MDKNNLREEIEVSFQSCFIFGNCSDVCPYKSLGCEPEKCKRWLAQDMYYFERNLVSRVDQLRKVIRIISDKDETPCCEGWHSPVDCMKCEMIECGCNMKNAHRREE